MRRSIVLLLVVLGLACSSRPLVRSTGGVPRDARQRVAVMPFDAGGRLQRSLAEGGSNHEAVTQVSRFIAEALSMRGVEVVPASDVETAFLGSGQIVPRGDVLAAAELVRSKFGATSVVLGEVTRYRERSGGASGSTTAASVAFRVRVYLAPEGKPLYRGEFDETQASITGDIFRARRYPGAGTRWLTAAELARFGADEVAREISGQR